ncbi:MAG: hypothetical protein HQ510_04795 [Candidatus Marinimicrobia bacterium]|nr:hypothetical protein [Candidatus Neomarinimicrobiota bacterium]
MKISNFKSHGIQSNKKNGFVFAVSALGVSLVVGLIVVFLFNTVTLETTTSSRTLAAKVAFWKAVSRVRMTEQLIKDYGFTTVSEGGIVGDVTFFPIDDCHRRIVSEINVGEFTRLVQGVLENELCDAEVVPSYSMVFNLDNDNYHPGKGYGNGWRHSGYGRGLGSWSWSIGTGTCLDIWGWHWDPPCEEDDVVICHNGQTLTVGAGAVAAHIANHDGDTLGACPDDDEDDDHGGGNNNNNNNNNNGDDDHDDDEDSQYGWFNIKGWDGILDGEIYIGGNTLVEYSGGNTKPHVGWDLQYTTNIKVPATCEVLPDQPLGSNNYTWENVGIMDLPDFDHLSYDSLLTIAQTMSHDPSNGMYVGNIDWPYDGQWGNTTIFNLHNYPNRVLFVRGDCTIKWCEVKNVNGSSSAPGIIVATGKIEIDSVTGGSIPDDIILITSDDIEIEDTNFGSNLAQANWPTVVNELYARGEIDISNSSRVLAQIYAFGGNHNSYSYRSQDVNTYGLLYLPNPDTYLDLASQKWFKGAMYVNRVKDDRFQDTFVLFHRKFPIHYLPGGIVGLNGGASQSGEHWVLVTGSLQEI